MPRNPLRVLVAVLAVAIALVTSGCTALGTSGPLSGPYTKTIWGPDVSNYQHPYGAGINWTAVRASGARFTFVKVSEGSWYTNPYSAGDIQAARAAGLFVAGYHFARPRLPLSTAASDARLFSSQLGNMRQPGFLPPVLDVETTDGLSAGDVTAWVRSFLSTLESSAGRVPMLYSGAWFWQGYLGNPGGFAHYPVWIAQYTPGDIGPNLFSDYSYSTFWQYTDSAYVPGISGGVDASWFHGNIAQLTSLAWTVSSVTYNSQRLYDRMLAPTGPAAGPATGAPTGHSMAQDPSVIGAP